MGVARGVGEQGDFGAAFEQGSAVAAVVLVDGLLDWDVPRVGEVNEAIAQAPGVVAAVVLVDDGRTIAEFAGEVAAIRAGYVAGQPDVEIDADVDVETVDHARSA